MYFLQEHFSNDMWENEQIFGKKQKLKPNAVPLKIPHTLQDGELKIITFCFYRLNINFYTIFILNNDFATHARACVCFYSFTDTIEMPKMMHLQLVSILKSKHIVNSEKSLEENIEKQMTKTDDVEITDTIMQEINNIVSDAPDCDNINPNITLMD